MRDGRYCGAKNTICMDKDMLHTLIAELVVAAGIIEGKESE